jgi:ABC-2 type transport system ATP-binding protein
VIAVEGLVKEFKVYRRRDGLLGSLGTLFAREHSTVRAVDGISFDIPAGARTAYIGVNGAGKSTTIKILAGIMRPTAGRCLVDGLEPYRERRRNARSIGVVFGQRSQLWWDLSVPDSFQILRHIYDIPEPVFRRNLALFRELLDIDALGSTPVRKLSLGQRMRAEVAASMLHDPKVLYLDEPTIGLDLVLKTAVRELIGHVNRELGTTVVLTSHDLGDIAAICDRVLVVDRGRLIHRGSLRDLLDTAEQRAVVFECGSPRPPDEVAAEITARLPGARASVLEGGRIRVEFATAATTSRQVLGFLLHHYDLRDFYAPEPSLETVIREIYRASAAPGEPSQRTAAA